MTKHSVATMFRWLALAAGLAFWPAASAADPSPDPDDAGESCPTGEYLQTGRFPEETTDADGDGVADIDDNCPGTVPIPESAVDSCGCATSAPPPPPLIDPCSLDSDGDGIGDCQDKCPGTHAGHRVGPDGCPLPLSEPIRRRVDVKFEFDRWRIQPGYEADLQRLRETLLRYPKITLRFEGHTDFTGPNAYNLKLSRRRAEACRDFVLQGGGIDPFRVNAVGFGEFQPIGSNRTTEGRAQNRRTVVEFDFGGTVAPANDQPPPTGTMAPEK